MAKRYAATSATPGTDVDALGGGSSPLTTDGDLYLRAGGVDARLPVGAEGQVLKVVSGAPVWATLDGATVLDLAAATYEAGSLSGGAATHVSGVARLEIGSSGSCDYLAGSTSAPRARIALPSLRSAWRWRAEVRLASIGSGGSGGNIWHAVVGVIHGAANHGAHVRVAFDGRPDLLRRDNGAQQATGEPGAVAIDGTGWIALEYDRDMLRVEIGTGSGTTPPSSWTQYYVAPLHTAIGATQPVGGGGGTAPPAAATQIYLALDRTGSSSAAAAVIDLGPVRLTDLGR